MANSAITSVSLFEIGKDQWDWPRYNYRVDWDVDPEMSMSDILEQAHACQLNALAANLHHGSLPRHSRYLDIVETRGGGTCLYLFRLNAEDNGVQRLTFARDGSPFIVLPLNSLGGEDFVTVHSVGGDGLEAGFTCDLGELRRSKLAGRIRNTPHDNALNIPFYFNIQDPVLGAAPWVLSEHSHAGTVHANLLTHGGVHPQPMALLSVAL
jgi:hypothetical protein